jgi:hypothetical protein
MPKCPRCEKEIVTLIRDTEADEHFKVWINSNGDLEEKSVFYDRVTTAFVCSGCLKPIPNVNTSEDAVNFLKDEKR